MKVKGLVILCLTLLALAATASAVEWKGKVGVGFRGQLYAPFNKGKNFALHGVSHELYMLGPGEAVFARYGLTRNIVLQAELEFVKTYDDTSATKNQTFKWRKIDNAKTHLRGHLFSLAANYYFNTEKNFQPYLMAGLGLDFWRVNDRFGPNTYKVKDIGLKLGAGLSYWIWERFTVEAQMKFTGGLFNVDSEMPEGFYGPGDWTEWDERPFRNFIQPSVAVAFYLFGQPDADKDGVKDADDDCPGTPRGAKVDKKGCPLDADLDGVFDGLDTCANTPQGVRVDGHGCPLDTDKDGVWDSWDACPETPFGIDVDDKGCPLDGDKDGIPDYQDDCANTSEGATVNDRGCPSDGDGDGVYDGIDRCPATAAGLAVDQYGCMLDADADGIADELDQCPNTPQLVIVDESGCPVAQPITTTIVLDRQVGFAVNQAELSDAAREALDGVVQSLLAYPETRIRISGFCDSTGAASYNLHLSEQRAGQVRDYFISKNIAADRMDVVGYGEDPEHFVADNGDAAGRARNRRVEIESISQ